MAERPQARQLVLDLPHRPALGREDFLVSESNAEAVAAIDSWPDWPRSGLVLTGPAGSGKSHLAGVWCTRSGAVAMQAPDIHGEADVSVKAMVIDRMDEGIDEVYLFHQLNRAVAGEIYLLLSARLPVAEWPLAVADVISRVRALPVARLDAPDDALMEAVMAKLFADRQLDVDAAVIGYLCRRLERSFDAIGRAVEDLDRAALGERRRITRQFAGSVLSLAA